MPSPSWVPGAFGAGLGRGGGCRCGAVRGGARGRPRGSQLAAWASEQSTVLPGRAALEASLAEIEARFDGVEVPLPPDWGGYVVRPTAVELWQGRPSRLHDRLRYRATASGWVLERLSP